MSAFRLLPALAAYPFLLASAASGQGGGLAEKYPGDAGLADDPQVVFYEDFESGSTAEIAGRFENAKNVAGMAFSSHVPAKSNGRQSLEMTSVAGQNDGGHLYKAFNPGFSEKLHLRYYIRYAGEGVYHHTGGRLGGYNPVSNWPLGTAGKKPNGSGNFSVAFEPVNEGYRLDFYNYWMGMRSWEVPASTYYGNHFIHDPELQVKPGEWMCVEFMVKMNQPLDASNGELALWIDGGPVIHLGPGYPKGNWKKDNFFPDSAGQGFEGFQWRSDGKLNLNWLLLQHYVTGDPSGHVGRVYFDHVVVARDYVGPLASEATSANRAGNKAGESPALQQSAGNGKTAAEGGKGLGGAAARLFRWADDLFRADGKSPERQ